MQAAQIENEVDGDCRNVRQHGRSFCLRAEDRRQRAFQLGELSRANLFEHVVPGRKARIERSLCSLGFDHDVFDPHGRAITLQQPLGRVEKFGASLVLAQSSALDSHDQPNDYQSLIND